MTSARFLKVLILIMFLVGLGSLFFNQEIAINVFAFLAGISAGHALVTFFD